MVSGLLERSMALSVELGVGNGAMAVCLCCGGPSQRRNLHLSRPGIDNCLHSEEPECVGASEKPLADSRFGEGFGDSRGAVRSRAKPLCVCAYLCGNVLQRRGAPGSLDESRFSAVGGRLHAKRRRSSGPSSLRRRPQAAAVRTAAVPSTATAIAFALAATARPAHPRCGLASAGSEGGGRIFREKIQRAPAVLSGAVRAGLDGELQHRQTLNVMGAGQAPKQAGDFSADGEGATG